MWRTKHTTQTQLQLSGLWKSYIPSWSNNYFLNADIYSLLFDVSKSTFSFQKDYHDVKQTSNIWRPRWSTQKKKKLQEKKQLWLGFTVKISRVGKICRYQRRKSLLKCGCPGIKRDHLSLQRLSQRSCSQGNPPVRRFNSHQVQYELKVPLFVGIGTTKKSWSNSPERSN